MQRNFFRRIELAFPIEDGVLRDRLTREILAISLADNVKARVLQPDASYRRARIPRGGKPRRSQGEFIAAALSEDVSQNGPMKRKTRFPQVKVARSPFAERKARR
jgi:polyphosphate kinase